MKRFVCGIVLVLSAASLVMADAVLRGKIVLLNSGGKPVKGVTVASFGAHTQVSSSLGFFELNFPDKNPGDVVFITVDKDGFEVINKKELDRVILRTNADELVEIVMCPQGSWQKAASEYYGTAAKAINDQFDKRFKEIEKQIIAGKDEIIRKLTQERDTALAQAKKIADDFAQVNLDEASDLYKTAFQLFQKGEIDKALETQDDAKLEQAGKNIAAENEKAKLLLMKTEKARKQLAEDYNLKAQLSIIKLRFDDAEKYYGKVLETDPDEPGHYLDFSTFLSEQNQFDKGREICKRALALKLDDADKAGLLHNIGTIYSDTGLFAEAEQAYTESLGIYRTLAETHPAAYRSEVAMTLNNLGTLYADTNRLKEAEQAYTESLGIYRKLAETDPAAYRPDVATTLTNLGNLYYKTARFKEAEQAYTESLSIRRKLAEMNPAAYRPDVATTLNNLGALYADTHRLKEAEQAYTESLSIRRTLAETQPAAYRPDVADILNNLGNLYSNTHRLTEAEQAYTEALSIRRTLAETNPAAYRPDVAMTLNNLGILYKDTNRMADSEQATTESLSIYRTLAETQPAAYRSYVATTLNNLGLLKITSEDYTSACAHLREAFEIREKLASQNPSAFDLPLCQTILTMAYLYSSAPDACPSIKEKIPSLLERAVTILKKYPDNPQAKNLLEFAEQLKNIIEKK